MCHIKVCPLQDRTNDVGNDLFVLLIVSLVSFYYTIAKTSGSFVILEMIF